MADSTTLTSQGRLLVQHDEAPFAATRRPADEAGQADEPVLTKLCTLLATEEVLRSRCKPDRAAPPWLNLA